MRRPLPAGGDPLATVFHYDELDRRIVIERWQDVEPILERNKRLYNDPDRGWSKSREFKRVATIPNVIVERLMREGIWNDERALARWLRDPDNRFFLTAPP